MVTLGEIQYCDALNPRKLLQIRQIARYRVKDQKQAWQKFGCLISVCLFLQGCLILYRILDSNIYPFLMTTHGTLPMPTLDGQKDELLNKVCQEGGFAYVTLVTLAAMGDVHAAEAAHDMAWEQLHWAPWHSVDPVWRDAYSLSCLHMASFHHLAGKSEEALRVLDMGVIMGGPLLRLDLNSAISWLQSQKNKGRRVEDVGMQEVDEAEENTLQGRDTVGNCSRQSHKLIGGWLEQAAASSKQQAPNRGECEVTDLDIADKCKRTKKCDVQSSISQVLQDLPHRSLCCKLIEKRPMLSLEDFLCHFFLPGIPIVITGAMSHWPAMQKWKDMEYLKRAAGDRTVPVEVGKNYLDSGWKQELITISQLLERIQSNECSPMTLTYLAQHPLFDQITELHEDIFTPDYCMASGGKLHSINAWLGPIGTVTPLHHDPYHNLLAQVVGKKYIRLYPASITEELYPYNEPMLNNSSQVDLDDLDHVSFPQAENLSFMDCILEEGEMLYIPPKWWHYVRSLSTSFSVSFWWTASNIDDEET